MVDNVILLRYYAGWRNFTTHPTTIFRFLQGKLYVAEIKLQKS